MSPLFRRVYFIGWVLALLLLFGLLAQVLLTPVRGNLLILASARQTDRLAASTIELHSASGWMRLGSFSGRPIPKAPDTATLLQASLPIGSYDAVRVAGHAFATQVQVQQSVLSTILVAVADGEPSKGGIYTGSETVSLGLNELAGHLNAMPEFSLLDQFGRPFTNATIAGHDAIVAAFHTGCHTTCPLYTGLFLQLRKQLPPSVMLVEATTAPEEDTPEALRNYAGSVGASWAFVTGSPDSMAAFWAPFTVQLSNGQSHSSTLALIDSHGYIRTYYQGIPDVAGQLPADLALQLNPDGLSEYRSHGNNWGAAQVIDTLKSIDSLRSPTSLGEGSAPDFTLTTLAGHQITLSKLRGRPVVINFWATYCAPCRREMPMLQRVAKAHPGMVLLLVDERDDQGAARAFVKQLGITPAVPLDPDGKVGDLYRVAGLPTTVFVRSDGSIEGRYLGETNEQILNPHLSAIGA